MADLAALDDVDNVLGDVLGVVGDALLGQFLTVEIQVKSSADAAG